MKKIALFLSVAIFAASCNKKQTLNSKVSMKNGTDSLSYAMGAMMGGSLKPKKIKDLNWEIFRQACEFAMKNGDSGLAIDKEKIYETYERYSNMELRKEADDYISKKRKEGKYQSTPSGLMFKSTKPGNGVKPSITDTAMVFYTGTFANGKMFDSNMGGEPMKVGMNSKFIKGFLEALTMMDEGSEAEVVIPYELAYGEKGNVNPYTGQTMIEPFQNLLFTIRLEKIVK